MGMKQNVKWNTSRQVTHRLPTLWERQNILAGQQVLKLHPNIEGETANHTWLSFLYTSAPPKKIEGKKERQRKKERKLPFSSYVHFTILDLLFWYIFEAWSSPMSPTYYRKGRNLAVALEARTFLRQKRKLRKAYDSWEGIKDHRMPGRSSQCGNFR